jgi:hypothetical protein
MFEESYCYALTNSINSGLPILYLDRGVFRERLKNYAKYFPCDISNINDVFQNYLEYIVNKNSEENYYKLNENIQPNRWYLENYLS